MWVAAGVTGSGGPPTAPSLLDVKGGLTNIGTRPMTEDPSVICGPTVGGLDGTG